MNLTIIPRLLAAGAIATMSLGTFLYARERMRLQLRRVRLARHLQRLRRLTARLLNALDRLLEGDTPEETVLYQWFSARGGEQYDDLRNEVHEALRRSQQALSAAYDLRRKLDDPDIQQSYPLEQQVWDWEMLCATLIGHSERIQGLSAEELRALLDPMPTTQRQTSDVKLARQLEDILREFTATPLRFRWRLISPARVAAKGILGYVDQVKTHIARLPERHRENAPRLLKRVQSQRRTAELGIPPFLKELHRYVLERAETRYQPVEPDTATLISPTGAQLFTDIDRRIAGLQAALDDEQYLEVTEQAQQILKDLETVQAFIRVMNEHGRRQAKIDAIVAQGYRPPRLSDDMQEIEEDVQTITRHIVANDYTTAAPWIGELETDSQRALDGAQTWQALHDHNVADLGRLENAADRAQQWCQSEVVPAWEMLQTYPPGNWADVDGEIESALPLLRRLRDEQLAEIESLNSMQVQQFVEAERMLTYADADLAQVEGRFQAVVNRLAEVREAEAHIEGALHLTEADLDRATILRDKEDAKIGPEVDQQIEQARRQLAEARRLAAAREFAGAVSVQTEARQLATAAYMVANEQVREINALQAQLDATAKDAQEKMEQAQALAAELPPVAQTSSTKWFARRLRDQLSHAQRLRVGTTDLEDRALAEGLQEAIAAYEEVTQLAEWMSAQLVVDRQEYQEQVDETLAAILDARALIQWAEQVAEGVDVDDVTRHALRRARLALPPEETIQDATKQALIRLREEAEEAGRYAKQAGA